jgi:hypothetical protein
MAALSDLMFQLDIEIAVRDVTELQSHVLSALAGRPWPAVKALESPSKTRPAKRMSKSPESSLEALVGDIGRFAKDPNSVRIQFAELSTLAWGRRPDGASYYVGLRLTPGEGVLADRNDYVAELIHFARGLLARGAITKAVIERFDDGNACVPFVPLAETRRPLVLTDEAEVAAHYERPAEFWSAGWTRETYGSKTLLTRCQYAIDKAEVLAETIDDQWQMARAAKPKRTVYADPVVTPEEKEIFERGEPRLIQVGVNAEGLVEFSCSVEPDEHIRGYEIYYLRELVVRKQSRDGTPITSVRVVFYDQAMAKREKRPLLDVGVRVYYQHPDTGDLVEVSE